jgi:CO/xanthine dehydrogenase FAD-binding subunit
MMAILQEYYRPATVAEAVSLLAESGGRLAPLAGGAELVGQLETRAAPGIQGVVDLRNLGLDGIDADEETIRLGATATLTDVMEHEVAGRMADGILSRAARGEGPVNLRNAATVGGVVAGAAPDSEFYAALLALDARVVTVDSQGESTQLLAEMGEVEGLITGVIIPRREPGSGLARIAVTPSDRPIVAAIAVVGEDGADRVALCGVAERPVLYGQELDPPGDFKASGAYRLEMVDVVVRRALEEARGNKS